MVSSLTGGSRGGTQARTGARTARHQRRHRPDREGAPAARIDALAGFDRAQRAVEPAGVDVARPRQTAFQHVLAVEMRTLAIRRRRRMHDDRLSLAVEPMQVRHRRVEREEIVEHERRRLALRRQRRFAAQRKPGRIARRRDRRQTIERAAQDDRQEPRIAALGASDARHEGPCEQRAAAKQRRAPGHGMVDR